MSRNRQAGLALVSVLLVMALILLLLAGMLRGHQLLISSSAQQIRALQLWHLALAGENHARQLLRQETSETPETVNLAQPWAETRDVELGPGTLRIRIEDLAGRFNLGALTRNGQVDPIILQRWQRLGQSLGVAVPAPQHLSGLALLDVSQLRLLPDVEGQALQRLRPWIALLPAEAGLNINTASPRLLETLEGLDPASARQLHEQRPRGGFESVQRFVLDPLVDGREIRAHGLAVDSRWFRVEVTVGIGPQRLYLYSDLERNPQTNTVRVLRRAISALGENETHE